MVKQRLTYDTPEIQMILDSVADKAGIEVGTTEYWNSRIGYIPDDKTLIIYTDYYRKVVDGETIYYPRMKIGTGNAYVQDLAFLGENESEALLNHMADDAVHTTLGEKAFWNRKLNVTDAQEVVEETLVFNRN